METCSHVHPIEYIYSYTLMPSVSSPVSNHPTLVAIVASIWYILVGADTFRQIGPGRMVISLETIPHSILKPLRPVQNGRHLADDISASSGVPDLITFAAP